MKFLLLASLLCLTSAELFKKAAPAVDDSILAFIEGARKSGSLSRAVGVDEEWLEQAGEDIRHELKERLKEVFEELLEKIKDNVDHGKQIGTELLDKAKEVRDRMEELGVEVSGKAKNFIENLRGKAKEAIQRILEKLGFGKRNLDDQMDALARSKFSELLEQVIEKVTSDETIQKFRDYVKKIASNSELAQEFKKLIEKLRDTDLKEIIRGLLDHKYRIGQTAIQRGETWDKIKNFFKDLKVKIDEHSKKFGEWVKNTWGQGLEKLKEKYGTVKAIAMEFVAHGKDVSAEVAREALEFFRPYKEDLGTLWNQLVEVAKQAIGQF